MRLLIALRKLFLPIKWWWAGQVRIKNASMQMKTAKEVMDKRDKLYKDYLEADRIGEKNKAGRLNAGIEVLEWVIGKRG